MGGLAASMYFFAVSRWVSNSKRLRHNSSGRLKAAYTVVGLD